MQRFLHHLLGPMIAVAILAGLFGTSSLHLTPDDVGEYHERVRAVVETFPYVIGDWVGRDVPVPVEATNMLRPNVILSRNYVNTRTGERVGLMLVHCYDARDLHGHYPPECYPAAGWAALDYRTRRMPTPDGDVRVAHYRFARGGFAGDTVIDVLNLMVQPNGQFSLGMGGLSFVAGDYRLRHYGAAQIQLLPDHGLTDERQADVWQTFFDALLPALQTIMEGASADRDAESPL
jgi:hypothetical protein